jgi:hypothetical protein
MSAAEACFRKRKLFRKGGQGRPKEQWKLQFGLSNGRCEELEDFFLRAANKTEAARKAFSHLKKVLPKYIPEGAYNPKLTVRLHKATNGQEHSPVLILNKLARRLDGALKAIRPWQMFHERKGGKESEASI